MKSKKILSWLLVTMLIFLTAASCYDPVNTSPQTAKCSGDLFVESLDVARVTPSPRETYSDNQTYTWDAPPYGVEVTGNGEAVLRVYYGSDILSEYRVFAAGVKGHAQFTVEKWNGAKDLTLNVGNYLISDTDAKNVCKLNVTAGQASISSIGTKYIVTVRPEINQVIVAVLEGKVEVTSLGQTVTLDSNRPEEQLVVITRGEVGSLKPVLDPGKMLEEVINGQDIFLEPPNTPGSLTLWADEQLIPALGELAKQYETATGVTVQILGVPLNEIRDQFVAAVAAGSAPDLLTLPQTQLYELAENKLLLPMEPGMNSDLLVPGTIQAFKVNGVSYGAPYVYTNLALVSNPEYVFDIDGDGIVIPSTWSELMRYVAEISKGREFFTGLMIPADGYHFFPIQSAFGGYVFGTQSDGGFNPQDIGLDSNGSLAAATWLEELVNSEPFFSGDEEAALQNFLGGNAAIILTGPWSLSRLLDGNIKYQIYSFPGELQESQPYLDADGFVISSASQASDYAQEFILKYLTTTDAMLAYSRILGEPPARRDALENLEDPDVRAFGIAGLRGIAIPNNPEMQYVWNPWTGAIQAIIGRTMSAREAFIGAANQIRQSLNP